MANHLAISLRSGSASSPHWVMQARVVSEAIIGLGTRDRLQLVATTTHVWRREMTAHKRQRERARPAHMHGRHGHALLGDGRAFNASSPKSIPGADWGARRWWCGRGKEG
jgi:hypothetical protein